MTLNSGRWSFEKTICRIISTTTFVFLVAVLSEAVYFVTDKEFDEELRMGNIIPDVIDKIPEDVLQVEYYNGIEPNLGHTLSPHATYIPPVIVRWRLFNKKKNHTIILIDLDAPTTNNPTDRSYIHWMLTNVPGQRFKLGETAAKYESILVPKSDTGKHRLVFLCYIQKKNIKVTEKYDDDKGPIKKTRSKFSHHDFAKKYNFDRLVAINFFYSKHKENFTYTTIQPEALKNIKQPYEKIYSDDD